MVAMEIIVTIVTKHVINMSQYKVAAMSYLIIQISAIRPAKLKFGIKVCFFTQLVVDREM